LLLNLERIGEESPYKILSDLEAEVITRLKGKTFDLLVKDGTLDRPFEEPLKPVGLIKEIQKLYIPNEKREILGSLKRGWRTPLFLIEGGDEGIDKLSWFVKLTESRTTDDIARLEIEAKVDLKEAVHIADLSAGLLPLFASDPLRDPRSPQNLLPIGWLEMRLRSLLGDSRLIRRTLLTSQGPR